MLALFVFLLLLPAFKKHGITRANYEKIAEGMTREEVEEILGAPPGNYVNGPGRGDLHWIEEPSGSLFPVDRLATSSNWASIEGSIWVGFDRNGKVVGKMFGEEFVQREANLLEKVREWLRGLF